MKSIIEIKNKNYQVDFSKPLDVSCPLNRGNKNPLAFGVEGPKMKPLEIGGFVGSVEKGGACNCEIIEFIPHCNGTHTECIGHITAEKISINQCLKNYFFDVILISVLPNKTENKDFIIDQKQLENALKGKKADALMIRTLPNSADKKSRNYALENPAYLTWQAAEWIAKQEFKHLLLDLPSVDKADDGGKLLAHKAYWQYPQNPRIDASITELIYVPNEISDGLYLLNLQIASFESDASPSKPVLYQLN